MEKWMNVHMKMYFRSMRIAGTSHIAKLMKSEPAWNQELYAWHAELQHGSWTSMSELLRDHPQAKRDGNSVLFALPGGLRIQTQFNFENGWAFIHFAGTEKEWARHQKE